jgi:hypothetical protein
VTTLLWVEVVPDLTAFPWTAVRFTVVDLDCVFVVPPADLLVSTEVEGSVTVVLLLF